MGSEHSILHILTPFGRSSVEVEWINYPQLPVLEKESTCTSTASPTSPTAICVSWGMERHTPSSSNLFITCPQLPNLLRSVGEGAVVENCRARSDRAEFWTSRCLRRQDHFMLSFFFYRLFIMHLTFAMCISNCKALGQTHVTSTQVKLPFFYI